jgi:hypothetical protein
LSTSDGEDIQDEGNGLMKHTFLVLPLQSDACITGYTNSKM